MIKRGRGLREDYWACYHDFDVEMAELAAKERHDRMECSGMCPYCLDWLEEQYPDKEKDEK